MKTFQEYIKYTNECIQYLQNVSFVLNKVVTARMDSEYKDLGDRADVNVRL